MIKSDIEKLLKNAEKYFKNADVVIDPYDMTYVWVSKYECEITGYNEEEQVGKQILINTEVPEEDITSMSPDVATLEKVFEKKLIFTKKSGEKITYTGKVVTLIFNDQPYLVGKL